MQRTRLHASGQMQNAESQPQFGGARCFNPDLTKSQESGCFSRRTVQLSRRDRPHLLGDLPLSGMDAQSTVNCLRTMKSNLFLSTVAGLALAALVPVVNAGDRLTIKGNPDGTITVEWTGGGVLLSAPAVIGPWQEIAPVASPYTFTPIVPKLFLRTRNQQQVYSENTVGYVQILLQPDFNLIHNPLDAGNGKNTVGQVLAGLPDGSTVYKYQATPGYVVNDYTTLFGWSDPTMSLAPGEGILVHLPSGTSKTITCLGEVMQGMLSLPLLARCSMVGSLAPEFGKIATDLKFPAADGDYIYTYDPSTYYTSYCYDEGLWAPLEPDIKVGQAFWVDIQMPTVWSRLFTVK